MQSAARSYATAAAILAAGSLTAVTSAVSPLAHERAGAVSLASFESDLIAPELSLAGPLEELQAEELSANASLVAQELAYNGAAVAREEAFLPNLTSALPGVTDVNVIDRLLDADNLLVGTYENLFNSILGADNFAPFDINHSLIVGGSTAPPPAAPELDATAIGVRGGDPFLSGQIGGLQGVTGNDLAALSYAVDGTVTAAVPNLSNDFITFDSDLIKDELAFNNNLVTEELAAEQAAFGSTNALNGSVDRVINIANLPLSTTENSFNSVIGATEPDMAVRYTDVTLPTSGTLPEEINASLLTGTGTSPTDIPNVFDTGNLGGAEGFFDQNAALFADVAGLNSAEITSALAPGVFEPTAFIAAIGGLFDPNAFSNLGADVTPIVSELGTILMSMF